MDWFRSLARLASLAARRGITPSQAPDAADMGTAFGLDASILSAGYSDFGPDDDEPAPSSWERRIVRRSSL
jgi:hypothetical protein